MKRDYYYLNNYKNRGEMGISRHAFEQIAMIATNQITGANVYDKRKKKFIFSLNKPVYCSFRMNGQVAFNIDVNVKMGVDIQKVCINIQEAVANAVTMMCETVPFSVEVKVLSVN
ncbi:MAG: Asp23/Gls24 family envelope stress response protein [Bacilli bacterium]|nr:Asp23/Gls24 family envelope stress response protein [Bacilli bacterium]